MLVDIIREEAHKNDTVMFAILPFISKSLKSTIKEMKLASLMAISLIACRSPLSRDYSTAFVKQAISSLKDAQFDEELRQKAM